MRVELVRVALGNEALPETSTSFESGVATRVVTETEQRPTILGLVATGRMRPSRGEVLIDGEPDRRALRRRVALIDAPDVSDPDHGVSLAGIISEELGFAGLPGDPRSVKHWAAQLHVTDHLATSAGELPAQVRVHVLAELAALRNDVEALVIVSPDRHGGDPAQWWAIAEDLADRGFAVLCIVGIAAHAALLASTPEPITKGAHA